MGLRAGLAAQPALVRLTPRDERGDAPGDLRVREAEEVRDRHRGVTPARVRLAAVVHAVAADAVVAASKEEGAHRGAVDAREGIRGGDLGQARDGGVRRGEVGHLTRAAAETAVGVLAQGEEADDVPSGPGVRGGVEERQRVDDPVAQPASARVEHDVPRAEAAEGLAQVRHVLVALEDGDDVLPPVRARGDDARGKVRGAVVGAEAGRVAGEGPGANRAIVDVPRRELNLPLRHRRLRGEVHALQPERVHRERASPETAPGSRGDEERRTRVAAGRDARAGEVCEPLGAESRRDEVSVLPRGRAANKHISLARSPPASSQCGRRVERARRRRPRERARGARCRARSSP